ncbi:tail fiber assembly protein, partial [Escherichia coli]|uniref:tail fiber assembly protein n=1 Tax=Escherichia coli TaxID=562 RepID=UPI00201A359C
PLLIWWTPLCLIRQILTRRFRLYAYNETVDDWKTELKLDMISDENKLQLTRWMAYIRQLKEMHFNDIASEGHYQAIPWPEKPE